MPQTRFVHSIQGSAPPAGKPSASLFTDPKRPAKRVTDALRAADPGDTINILDAAIYAEGEILIDKEISIVSAAGLNSAVAKPTSPLFKVERYPRLRPAGGSSRVLRIQGPTRNAFGKVLLQGLVIENGRTINNPGEPAWGAGGGIAVVDIDDVSIRDCLITNNRTESVPFGTYSPAAFKDTVIAKLKDVLSLAPGMDKSKIDGVVKSVRDELNKRLPDRKDNNKLAGQSFGGGVCFAWSSGKIQGCRIEGNHANGRGGGIAVFGYGWPSIQDCHIVNNASGTQGWARRDGGGIGIEISLPERISRDLTERDMIQDLEAWLRLAPTAQLVAMLGASLAAACAQAIARGDFGKFTETVMYQFTKTYLAARRWVAWEKKDIEQARTRSVFVGNSRITGNQAYDDGGGLYASVLSRVKIESTDVSGNTAQNGAGGAIRVSMGSDLAVVCCTIGKNKTGAGIGSPRPGGGGIASRNTQVLLIGTSAAPTTIDLNVCPKWAGGGVWLAAESEGNMAGVADLWHAILTEVFQFTEMSVRMEGSVQVVGNAAGTSGAASPHGKGGGFYILRTAFPDAPVLSLKLEQFQGQVFKNIAYAPAKAATNDIDLVDLGNNVDDGDAAIGKHTGPVRADALNGPTTFRYVGR